MMVQAEGSGSDFFHTLPGSGDLGYPLGISAEEDVGRGFALPQTGNGLLIFFHPFRLHQVEFLLLVEKSSNKNQIYHPLQFSYQNPI